MQTTASPKQPQQEPAPLPYRGQVFEWRLERLRQCGYPAREAAALAERRDVDLHGAVDLLRQGCPVELALRILL